MKRCFIITALITFAKTIPAGIIVRLATCSTLIFGQTKPEFASKLTDLITSNMSSDKAGCEFRGQERRAGGLPRGNFFTAKVNI